ncbi:MAG: glycine cleavage system protein H [Gemmataceae bacterium]|nr:glycine cleavage system protein H [Gemmataceae bacterium]
MSEELTFMMGKYAARLPVALRYARNHMWCEDRQGGLRFGFTAYAVRLMQDVYFLDWCVDEGSTLQEKQRIGNIETSKAVSDLFAPIAGRVLQLNRAVLADPSAINADCYGSGWLFELAGIAEGLMDAAGYHAFLEAGWETTQRILKNQVLRD